MTVTAWRIFKARHAATAMTGEGARQYGGRWNSPGTPVVYAAGSISLAVLELLVHLDQSQILSAYQVCELTLDESLIEELHPSTLPANWKSFPAPQATQSLGDSWIEQGSRPVLRVSSVIIESEWNYLINPAHRGFDSIHIGAPQPFVIDQRLNRP